MIFLCKFFLDVKEGMVDICTLWVDSIKNNQQKRGTKSLDILVHQIREMAWSISKLWLCVGLFLDDNRFKTLTMVEFGVFTSWCADIERELKNNEYPVWLRRIIYTITLTGVVVCIPLNAACGCIEIVPPILATDENPSVNDILDLLSFIQRQNDNIVDVTSDFVLNLAEIKREYEPLQRICTECVFISTELPLYKQTETCCVLF